MAVWRKRGRLFHNRAIELGAGKFAQPRHQLAAVADRRAEQHGVLVNPIGEDVRRDRERRHLGQVDQHADRAGGADRQGNPLGRDRAGADVGADAVPRARNPPRVGKQRPAESEFEAKRAFNRRQRDDRGERCWVHAGRRDHRRVPGGGAHIHHARRGGHGDAGRIKAVRALKQEIAEREPPRRPSDRLGTRSPQPPQLRRPVAGMEAAAGAVVDLVVVQLRLQHGDIQGRARVAVHQDGRRWRSRRVNAHERMPEARDADRVDRPRRVAERLVKAGERQLQQGDGLDLDAAVRRRDELDFALRLAPLDAVTPLIEKERAHRRGSDVERKHQRRHIRPISSAATMQAV